MGSQKVRQSRLTAEALDVYLGACFDVACRAYMRDRYVMEALLLINRKRETKLLSNVKGEPFFDRQVEITRIGRSINAVAAVHLGMFAFLPGPQQILVTQPEYSDAPWFIAGTGVWPAQGLTRVRMAEVIKTSAVPDLMEVTPHILGRHWLNDLFPSTEGL